MEAAVEKQPSDESLLTTLFCVLVSDGQAAKAQQVCGSHVVYRRSIFVTRIFGADCYEAVQVVSKARCHVLDCSVSHNADRGWQTRTDRPSRSYDG